MDGREDQRDEQRRHETWRALYDFLLDEHERRLEAIADRGVSPGDLKALVRLEPGRREPMRALAVTWRCDASTVTWVVDRLEKQGLVERQAHQSDRRIKVVTLTPRGAALRAQLLDDLYRLPAALSALSPADLQTLHRITTLLRSSAGTTPAAGAAKSG